MSPKNKIIKRKALQVVKELSKKDNLSIEEFKKQNKQKDWYTIRTKVKEALNTLILKDNRTYKVNTLTGIVYRELKKAEQNVFYLQLKKKIKSNKNSQLALKYYENTKNKKENESPKE